MSPNKNNSLFKDSDDLLHNPDKTLKWRESYYFNWIDFNNKISGFSTIGILPNEKRREFVCIIKFSSFNFLFKLRRNHKLILAHPIRNLLDEYAVL